MHRRYVNLYPFVLLAAWIAAWLLFLALRPRIGWGMRGDTIYWVALKLLVWVLPVFVAIRYVERIPVGEFLEMRRPVSGALWGCGVGAALAAVTFVGRTLPSGVALHVPAAGLSLVNAVVVAPIVEELTLRGFLLKRLELNGHAFWRANVLTSVVFVAMHLPGWYFQGRATSLATVAAMAAPIAGLSLLFGWTKQRSASLHAAIVLHAINNLYSAIFP